MRHNSSMKAMIFLAAIAIRPESPAAQTLGQLATASPSAVGEGAVFMLAGNDAFRTGAALRFRLSRASDIGLQLGFDREDGTNSVGGGIDLKLAILESREEAPLALALDVSGGALDSDDRSRYELGLGLIASGAIPASGEGTIEPYIAFVVAMRWYEWKYEGDCGPPGGECPFDTKRTDTVVRAGVKIPVSKESQFLAEISLDRRTLFGGAFNLVF